MTVLIKNARTLESAERKDILIDGSRIAQIAGAGAIKNADEKIDASGMLAMPGLVNMHTHIAMSMYRGYADDMELMDWLQNKIWPLEDKTLNDDFVNLAVELSCAEMIKSGTTSFLDMYTFQLKVGGLISKIGMRGYLGEAFFDFKSKDYEQGKALDFAKKFASSEFPKLITPVIAAHAPYTCCEDTLIKTKEIANKHDMLYHIHVAETKKEQDDIQKQKGKRVVKYLDDIKVLDKKTIAAHCVWLDDSEIDIFAKRGVTVAHCPNSNMKLASGPAPIKKMLAKNVNVAIGTDGCASNNTLDLFREIKSAALLSKLSTMDATAVSAREAVEMATANAYKTLGLDCGLQQGKLADIILVDLRKPHLTPIYNAHSHMVYAANGSDVDTVIVNGKILMKSRKLKTIDEQALLEKAEKVAESV
ncbi:MAG: amidohydrolase [Candidatus Micrarchaeota archaeon]